ncbi:MAG: hypothetical protein LBS88_13655 [Tannerellaceae bacterium]|jgi:hypothetical protein|nr:hypothetical protein [Tannerellaceae bacterium]
MDTEESNKGGGKPFIIANPIYDTVFKRLMENQRIAKFFLSTILDEQVEDITVLPQEFTYKLDETKVSDKAGEKGKKGGIEYYAIFRLDFMATVRDSGGSPRRILIELQKSWDTVDVMRFRRYLGEQYKRVDKIDGKETILPITTIYILGKNLAGTDCPCVRAGRTYTDMLNNTTIRAKSEFIENLTHDSYVIQAGRITDVRYTTNLGKLLSIFEQRYFIAEDSGARKEYPYQPDDENMKLITDVLYEMGADPRKRKEIEDEEEALRVYNLQFGNLIESIKEKDKTIEENKKTIEEKDKENAELKEKLAELERLLRDKQIE